MIDQPLQIGIIGFGRLAQYYYVPALRKMGRQIEICVADPLESSRLAAAKAFGNVRTYSDYKQLLQNESPHAVLVATPPSQHLEIWSELSRLGLPVFMEKPFLLADELEQINSEDPAWNRLMIDFNRRFWPSYRNLTKIVTKGSLGRIKSARFVLNVNVHKWSDISNHRALPGEGGALYDLGSQILDLALITFAQEPLEILARRSGTGALDEKISLTIRYPEGLEVECDLAYGTRDRECAIIEGENATLQLRNPNYRAWIENNVSTPGRVARSVVNFAFLGYRGVFRNRSMLRYSINASLLAFFDAVRNSQPFSPGFKDALRVARWIKAAADSMD